MSLQITNHSIYVNEREREAWDEFVHALCDILIGLGLKLSGVGDVPFHVSRLAYGKIGISKVLQRRLGIVLWPVIQFP